MKLKVGLKLRKLGNVYMIVAADESSVNMTNVYNLNSVAADIWQHIGAGDFTIPVRTNIIQNPILNICSINSTILTAK